MRHTPPLRITRALSVTTLITALAAAAHTGAGGQLPAPPILTALFLLVLLPVSVCTRARLGLPAVAVLLGAGQLALHEAFTAFAPVTSCAPGHLAAWSHHAPSAWAGCAVPSTLAGQAPADPALLLMPAFHLVASALAAVLLAKGETALWAAAAWLSPLASLPRPVLFPARPPQGTPIYEGIRVTYCPPKAHRRRGPPFAAAPAP